MCLIILLTIFFRIQELETIRVVVVKDKSIITQIEKEVLENTVKFYNQKSTTPYRFIVDTVNSFQEMMDAISDSKSEKHHIMALGCISKNEDRLKMYSFSSRYMPAREVVFTLSSIKNTTSASWRKKGTVIGYQSGTMQSSSIAHLEKKYGIKKRGFATFEEKIEALKTGKINYAIGDNVELWHDQGFHILQDLEVQQGDGICILFPKGSLLRDKLDKYLLYYVHSPRFYNLIRDIYGADVSLYFKQNL